MGMQQPLTRSAETPGQQAADLGLLGAAYRNRTDDLIITRELHTRKALNWLASAASTKSTQLGQHDLAEVVYVQNVPTHRSRLDNYRSINAAGERPDDDLHTRARGSIGCYWTSSRCEDVRPSG